VFDGSNQIVAVTSFGLNPNCMGNGFASRTDIANAQSFILPCRSREPRMRGDCILGMMKYHTAMAKAKVAVTLENTTLRRLDRLVSTARFANRSQAIEAAVEEKLERLDRRRLAEECGKLDPEAEKALAELGLDEDAGTWPQY
jgi:Arc/MetJ-type ribon-helix-helix transcriptional regulator